MQVPPNGSHAALDTRVPVVVGIIKVLIIVATTHKADASCLLVSTQDGFGLPAHLPP
jgi:hypothetical protein